MSSNSIVSGLTAFKPLSFPFYRRSTPRRRPDLHTLWLHPTLLPHSHQASPLVQSYLDLLGPLDWDQFPERNLQRNWGRSAVPYAAFCAACLVKLDRDLSSMADLCRFLREQPPLANLLGLCSTALPTQRHLARLLHTTPHPAFQFLFQSSVTCLLDVLKPLDTQVGECISLDTKHILAWVKENNPKAYVSDRFNKDRQPKGDPDCKLGCKRRHNQLVRPVTTPKANPRPAETIPVGEFYWGYASGIVAVKVPEWGEFILAELTQPFDRPDVSYFFPLMTQAEQCLGFRPRFGALDSAFDAFYVYDYFHANGGFAAVPFSEKGGYQAKGRHFTPDGTPLCAAGLPMRLQTTFQDHTRAILAHERAKYACPLRSQPACPVEHKNWAKGGCTVDLPTSVGARLRYTLDRESDAYHAVYRQRTATERIFSQAKDLGIERPILRNEQAIANLNTLIYTLINLRLLRRIQERRSSTG